MSAQKLTRWFPGKVKPAREGVYERDFLDGVFLYSRWDGSEWLWGAPTVKYAAESKFSSTVQRIRWRGLTSDPKAGA